MKRLLLHLILPALVAGGAFWYGRRVEMSAVDAFVVYGVLGFMYYSAPHLLWAVITILSRAPGAICHAGFIAANLALIAIVLFSLTGARDPSGLPLQWVAYWPGAIFLQALFVAVTAAFRYSNSRVGA